MYIVIITTNSNITKVLISNYFSTNYHSLNYYDWYIIVCAHLYTHTHTHTCTYVYMYILMITRDSNFTKFLLVLKFAINSINCDSQY